MKPSSASPAIESVEAVVARVSRKQWSNPIVLALCTAMGLEDPEQAILACARELSEETELRRPHQRLEVLASFREIIRIDRKPIPDAGRLIPTFEGLVIEVNSRNSAGRQNFSICHEIGHTFFPTYREHPVARHDPSTGHYTPEEAEEEYLCDLAASELLMPSREFDRELAHQRTRVWSIPTLAREFGASLEATAIRCLRADRSLKAVLVWELRERQRVGREEHANPSDPEAESSNCGGPRLRYARYGDDCEDLEFERGEKALPGSLVRRALESDGACYGADTLPAKSGPVRLYAESQAFTHLVDEGSKRKVLTLVFGGNA